MLTEIPLKRNLHFNLCTAVLLGIATFDCSSQSPSTSVERDSAFALEQQGKYSESEAAWQTVLKRHPGDSEANAHLGLLEARQEHYREAVLYRKVSAAAPPVSDALANIDG